MLTLFLAISHVRSRRRDRFLSLVSWVSLIGMVLGVSALIVVTSVMNGFEAELRSRILDAVAHGYADLEPGQDWRLWQQRLQAEPEVLAAAPYLHGEVMLQRGGQTLGVELWAVDPQLEKTVSRLAEQMSQGQLEALQAGGFGVVLGEILARQLRLEVGDDVEVLLPRITVTPLGLFPRQKRLRLVGIFASGSQLDATTALVHLADGQRLYQRGEEVQGLRLKTADVLSAPRELAALQQRHPELEVKDWRSLQGSLFAAVTMEKRMVALLLLAIVAIASFNIVSVLTMMVTDKRGDIAVLRTLGMVPGAIRRLFLWQGALIGAAGVTVGTALGLPLAWWAGDIVAALESWTGLTVFDPGVYFIARIPSLVRAQDVAWVVALALGLSLLASIYPAARAARIEPAEALRHEL